jgi:hypothetical protein
MRSSTLAQCKGVPYDILIIFKEKIGRKLRQVEKMAYKRIMEMVGVVFIESFQTIIAQYISQLFKAPDIKKRKHPLVQNQLLTESHVQLVVVFAFPSCHY